MNFFDQRLPCRFWDKCIPEPNTGCWLWLAGRNPDGYGAFKIQGQMRGAHRVAYLVLVGEVAPGLELDHRCKNTACCNPAHLEPVTHRVNVLRGSGVAAQQAAQTTCRNGHPLDTQNTYRFRNHRACRTCIRERAAQRAA